MMNFYAGPCPSPVHCVIKRGYSLPFYNSQQPILSSFPFSEAARRNPVFTGTVLKPC